MPTARDAQEIGAAIRAERRAQRLTQSDLARRAGVSRQWLVAVERGHDRAELGKLNAVLAALGRTLAVRPLAAEPSDRTWFTARTAARAIREEIETGDTDFALRMLGRAVADFRSLDDPADVAAFLAEPPSTGDHRWDTLLAATVGRECRTAGIAAPPWTNPPPLESWWFPVFDPVLTARTLQRTPIDFSAKGIWLDARALETV